MGKVRGQRQQQRSHVLQSFLHNPMGLRRARYLGYRIAPSTTLHSQVIGYLLSLEDLSQSTFDLRHMPDQ
jgi:hypothetical protein